MPYYNYYNDPVQQAIAAAQAAQAAAAAQEAARRAAQIARNPGVEPGFNPGVEPRFNPGVEPGLIYYPDVWPRVTGGASGAVGSNDPFAGAGGGVEGEFDLALWAAGWFDRAGEFINSFGTGNPPAPQAPQAKANYTWVVVAVGLVGLILILKRK